MSDDTSKVVEVYTDGGTLVSTYGKTNKGETFKGGIGAWAYLILDPDSKESKILEEKGQGEIDTTNNRMEMTAAIKAIQRLEELEKKLKFTKIKIYTDSQYLQKGISLWIRNWKKNKWKNHSGMPVKNKELWEILDSYQNKYDIKYYWVKGHGNSEFNNRVDLICQEEERKTLEASKK
jgi:ribonuclease HI